MRDQLSRRGFLQTGVAVAGGVFTAESILLGSQPAEASMRPVQASDRVRFGVIGVGMLGVLTLPVWIGVISRKRHVDALRKHGWGLFCAICHYNLLGNASGVCPECGTKIQDPVL